MLWADERYVRVYTRDTVDWQSLSFDAQALLLLLLRKVDRAGLLPLGKHGKRGVAIVIGHAREWERLAPALEELLSDGCVTLTDDGRLFVPNFLAAQEATSSDKARQQKVRELARAVAAAQSVTRRDAVSQDVTECHKPSRAVTDGHDTSHAVTPSLAVPCLTVPISIPVADAPDDLPDATEHAVEVLVAQAPLLAEALPEKPESTGTAPAALQALWNRLAVPKGLQRWKSMSKARLGASKAALAAVPDLAKWEAWLAYELGRPWNMGQNGTGWRADVDWLLAAKRRDQVADFDSASVPVVDDRFRPRLGPKPVTTTTPTGDRPRL